MAHWRHKYAIKLDCPSAPSTAQLDGGTTLPNAKDGGETQEHTEHCMCGSEVDLVTSGSGAHNDGTVPAPTPTRDNRPPTLFGIFERLLAAAAVLGAAIYVLLNALYVEYLDDFGLRPEDVGLDRLAVLGRAAWIALMGLGIVAFGASIVIATGTLGRGHSVRPTTVRLWYACGTFTTVIILLLGFLAMRHQVEESAEDAKAGNRVGGLGWIVEFVDIRALPARVAWVSSEAKPSLVTDSDYLYLGRGDRVVALLSCEGRTIMLHPDDVVVQVLDYDSDDGEQGSIC